MFNSDVTNAQAYVSYRMDILAEHQANVQRKDRKAGKASLKLWKKIVR